MTVSGAEVLNYIAEGGDCNATTPVTYYASSTEAIKVSINSSTKIAFVCGFPNASVVPTSISFIGSTAARGEKLVVAQG